METELKLAPPDEPIEPEVVLPSITFNVDALIDQGRVKLAFGRAVSELHLHPADAVAIGSLLIAAAGALRGENPKAGPRVIFWDTPGPTKQE